MTAAITALGSAQAVQLVDVSCHIGDRPIIEELSLQVDLATIAGVLGPNGAGKSTLLALVMGLRRASAGSVIVLGTRLPTGDRALRRRMGVVMQETALYEELTSAENLRFTASLYGVRSSRRRIAEVLELLGLTDRSADVVHTLSGGLRRRLTIARALLHDPELLVIDEPTLGVDAEARHAIWSHLRLIRSLGTTVLVATNYLDEAQALCDKVAVLRAGRLVAYETPDALVARTGRCIDVECDSAIVDKMEDTVAHAPGVLGIERTPSGATIFLTSDASPDDLVRQILRIASIRGFRIRAADLAEVFRSLERVS